MHWLLVAWFFCLLLPAAAVAGAASSFLCFWPFCFLFTAARGQHLPLLHSQGSWSAGRWLFPAFRPHSCEGKGDNLSPLVEGGKVLLNLATAELRSARTKRATERGLLLCQLAVRFLLCPLEDQRLKSLQSCSSAYYQAFFQFLQDRETCCETVVRIIQPLTGILDLFCFLNA